MPYDGETLRERHRRVRAFVIASDRHRADFETRVARLGDDLKAEKIVLRRMGRIDRIYKFPAVAAKSWK